MRLRNVHNDKRGEINVVDGLLCGGREITLIHTNIGFARGGCLHEVNDEYHVMIEGKMEYHIGNDIKILNKGEILRINKNTPHYCIALQNSTTIEFGTTSVEQGVRYDKFRKIVDEINEKN